MSTAFSTESLFNSLLLLLLLEKIVLLFQQTQYTFIIFEDFPFNTRSSKKLSSTIQFSCFYWFFPINLLNHVLNMFCYKSMSKVCLNPYLNSYFSCPHFLLLKVVENYQSKRLDQRLIFQKNILALDSFEEFASKRLFRKIFFQDWRSKLIPWFFSNIFHPLHFFLL